MHPNYFNGLFSMSDVFARGEKINLCNGLIIIKIQKTVEERTDKQRDM